MKTFTLSYTYKVIKDGQTEMCFRPSDESIDDYLATYKVYNTLAEALADADNSITELTPLMFADFQNADSIPQSLKDQFIL